MHNSRSLSSYLPFFLVDCESLPINTQSELLSPIDVPSSFQFYSNDRIKHYNRAVEMHQKEVYQKAIIKYKTAGASKPRLLEAWSNLVGIYHVLKQYPEAINAFNMALTLDQEICEVGNHNDLFGGMRSIWIIFIDLKSKTA